MELQNETQRNISVHKIKLKQSPKKLTSMSRTLVKIIKEQGK